MVLVLLLLGFIILLSVLMFAFRRFMRGPNITTRLSTRLDGKCVVITGGNTGIGKETARELVRRGARVVILCRDMTKASKALKELKSNCASAEVSALKLDLASLKSVRSCAKALLDAEHGIDMLINNAGVMACPHWTTEDGFEMQFGTNHLGHFLLTELLLPKIKQSAKVNFTPRIIIVSSIVHRFGKMDWDNMNWERGYGPSKAYWRSKLANILHARELAKRLQDSGVSVYSLHPGVIASELARHYEKQWFGCVIPYIYYPFIKTPFYGAQTTLYTALDTSIASHTGRYYSDCREVLPAKQALNDNDARRLWTISEELVGLKK